MDKKFENQSESQKNEIMKLANDALDNYLERDHILSKDQKNDIREKILNSLSFLYDSNPDVYSLFGGKYFFDIFLEINLLTSQNLIS